MRVPIAELIYGTQLTGYVAVLKSITGKPVDGRIPVIFADRSGEVNGEIAERLIDSQFVGKVVIFNGAVLTKNGDKLVIPNEIRLAENTEYQMSDVFAGISDEKKHELISQIRSVMQNVQTPSYRRLLEVCLTDEILNQLADLPATLSWYGTYRGGALVSTACVTYMAINSMATYVKRGNGITNTKPNYSLLITAGLLHCFGKIEFFDKENCFKKSEKGMSMQYFSTLQHMIDNVIFANKIEISDHDLGALMNVLAVTVPSKTDVKAVSKEGSVLRQTLRLYAEADQIDWQIANHTEEEQDGYYFSEKLRRYILTDNEERGDE